MTSWSTERAAIADADLTPHNDPRDLGVYLWNEKVLANYFCKTCGIFTYIGDGENGKALPVIEGPG